MADLTKPIIFNGHTASGLTNVAGGGPSRGCVIEELDFSNVSVAAYLDKRALQDGMDASDVYLGMRSIRIVAGIYGTTRGDLWDQVQDFLAAYSPTLAYDGSTSTLGFVAFKFSQPTADITTWPTSSFPNGIPLQVFARPAAPPTYLVSRLPTGGASGKGLSQRVAALLVAQDPRKVLQDTRSLAPSGATTTIPYRGDYPSFPIFTWSITSSPSNLTIVVDGQTFVIGFSGVSSGSFHWNWATQALVDLTDSSSKVGLIGTFGSYVPIGPASTVTATIPAGINDLTLVYREAFA